VCPELVEYSDNGEPFMVRYHLLGAMLLNEVQREEREIREQQEKIDSQASQIVQLHGQLVAIAGQLKQSDRREPSASVTADQGSASSLELGSRAEPECAGSPAAWISGPWLCLELTLGQRVGLGRGVKGWALGVNRLHLSNSTGRFDKQSKLFWKIEVTREHW